MTGRLLTRGLTSVAIVNGATAIATAGVDAAELIGKHNLATAGTAVQALCDPIA